MDRIWDLSRLEAPPLLLLFSSVRGGYTRFVDPDPIRRWLLAGKARLESPPLRILWIDSKFC